MYSTSMGDRVMHNQIIKSQHYKLRHLVENAFLHLKQWRGITAHYAKNSASQHSISVVSLYGLKSCDYIL